MRYYNRPDYTSRKNLPKIIRYYTPLILFAVDNFPSEIIYAHPRLASNTVAQEVRWAGAIMAENPTLLPKQHNKFPLVWPLLAVKTLPSPGHVLIRIKTKLDPPARYLLGRLRDSHPTPNIEPIEYTMDPLPEPEPDPIPTIPLLSFDEVSVLCVSALSTETTIEFTASLTDTEIETLESNHRGLAIIPTGPNQYKAL